MTTREYLNQFQQCEKIRQNKFEELNYLESLATGLSSFAYDSERVQTSGAHDKMAETVVRIVDLQSEIVDVTNECIEKCIEVRKTIDSVKNSVLYNLLFKKYIEGKSLDTIADEMGYTYQWIKELHMSAISEIKKIKGFDS